MWVDGRKGGHTVGSNDNMEVSLWKPQQQSVQTKYCSSQTALSDHDEVMFNQALMWPVFHIGQTN